MQAGIISAAIANFAPFMKHDRPFTPQDFMPGQKQEILEAEEAAEVLGMMFGPNATKESARAALKRWN